jgi:hypothetical protein
MFQGILYEFKAMNLDEEAYLEHFLSLIEKGLDPEPGVQDFGKFHNGVKNASEKAMSTTNNLRHIKHKSRGAKEAFLTKHKERLGKLAHASDVAARFAGKSGNVQHADGHTKNAERLRANAQYMGDTSVPRAKKKK